MLGSRTGSGSGQCADASSLLVLPSGVTYTPGFLGSSEAEEVLTRIDEGTWNSQLMRRTQHFGYRYDYKTRRARMEDHIGPLPEWLLELAQMVHGAARFPKIPDQAIVNEYLPGQGIAPHIDCEPCFGPVIASLSLGSGTSMQFRNPGSGDICNLYLEPCSLVTLASDGRFSWTHGIAPRKSDLVQGRRLPRERRVSVTFRSMAFES